jgi:hypothetical protein
MIVYVLSNPAMPGIIKIGMTSNEDATARIDQLYTTGLPLPFKLEFACRVENGEEVERALHIAFNPQRVNPRREFFQVDPEQPIALLRLLHEDVTGEIAAQPSNVDQESVRAAEAMVARRPNLNFHEMGIPDGSILQSTDGDSTATVIAPRKVSYKDQEMSLTAATRQMLELPYSVQPTPYWTFNGRSLRDIYGETYSE